MAKQITRELTLQIPAGKATPAPPIGTALGPLGINLQEFCTKYNEATRDKMGDILPAKITVYEDRTFDFVIKTPPTANLLKKYAHIDKGSVKGANHIVATLTKEQIREIAEIKLPDLNAYDIEAAMKIVEGTARNMGIAVKGVNDAELASQEKEALEEEKEQAEREAELAELEAETGKEAPEVPVIEEKKDSNEEA
ncbi:MAG TPA: 50S ribosomal protein L11 [Candidatus Faecenecus gallistercoris]|uniref:Large ribosomal subunit protein uL11 n=1 Tax=Candidatus Faecenecus gallistercoris TaxID=2840793 RepID=A0A9D1CKK9_9FIRM|nr:MAG: 50S ribosomal protein L11 [Bacillota bacterium]CDE08955.1 50S ribosomal protein L11 [Bacillus sp. CAG:988]HIQ64925.1 50S ribosomal protein L11 [Candidatus Faecenecus gallistercoris]